MLLKEILDEVRWIRRILLLWSTLGVFILYMSISKASNEYFETKRSITEKFSEIELNMKEEKKNVYDFISNLAENSKTLSIKREGRKYIINIEENNTNVKSNTTEE